MTWKKLYTDGQELRVPDITRRCLGWCGTHLEPRILYDAGPGAPISDTICDECRVIIEAEFDAKWLPQTKGEKCIRE